MVLEQILSMYRLSNSDSPLFPPTELYNEGWLLRLILDWFSTHKINHHPLNFPDSAKWFSEALLPSAFKPRWRKDLLGESRTHADGVIGYFSIGDQGKADLKLNNDGNHFVVMEAKIFSRLSSGVTHADYFDQAARTVACIAEILHQAGRSPDKIKTGFYILAPESQISDGTFREEIEKASIESKVQRRVSKYPGKKDQWMTYWFKPTLQNISLLCISWEEIVEAIDKKDSKFGPIIKEFYNNCLHFNGKTR